VRDTGIGIPAGKRQAIFEAFRQCDGSTTRKYGGTGLGLAISARLVEMMGGRLTVESEEGQGSEFHFAIPLKLARPSCSWTGNDRRQLPLAILLGEDHPASQQLVAAMLRQEGHTVTVAGDGVEVLAALERQPYDVVLMDIQMPRMDGLQATSEIRSREIRTGCHIPIIALTAHAMTGDRQRCLDSGMDDYVAKPVRPEELRAALARFAAGNLTLTSK
jgi:CheY-like chemotaxis protein